MVSAEDLPHDIWSHVSTFLPLCYRSVLAQASRATRMGVQDCLEVTMTPTCRDLLPIHYQRQGNNHLLQSLSAFDFQAGWTRPFMQLRRCSLQHCHMTADQLLHLLQCPCLASLKLVHCIVFGSSSIENSKDLADCSRVAGERATSPVQDGLALPSKLSLKNLVVRHRFPSQLAPLLPDCKRLECLSITDVAHIDNIFEENWLKQCLAQGLRMLDVSNTSVGNVNMLCNVIQRYATSNFKVLRMQHDVYGSSAQPENCLNVNAAENVLYGLAGKEMDVSLTIHEEGFCHLIDPQNTSAISRPALKSLSMSLCAPDRSASTGQYVQEAKPISFAQGLVATELQHHGGSGYIDNIPPSILADTSRFTLQCGRRLQLLSLPKLSDTLSHLSLTNISLGNSFLMHQYALHSNSADAIKGNSFCHVRSLELNDVRGSWQQLLFAIISHGKLISLTLRRMTNNKSSDDKNAAEYDTFPETLALREQYQDDDKKRHALSDLHSLKVYGCSNDFVEQLSKCPSFAALMNAPNPEDVQLRLLHWTKMPESSFSVIEPRVCSPGLNELAIDMQHLSQLAMFMSRSIKRVVINANQHATKSDSLLARQGLSEILKDCHEILVEGRRTDEILRMNDTALASATFRRNPLCHVGPAASTPY